MPPHLKRRGSGEKGGENVNIFRKMNKHFRRICGSYEKVYRDSRPLELCKAALIGIMEKQESCEPFITLCHDANAEEEENADKR